MCLDWTGMTCMNTNNGVEMVWIGIGKWDGVYMDTCVYIITQWLRGNAFGYKKVDWMISHLHGYVKDF